MSDAAAGSAAAGNPGDAGQQGGTSGDEGQQGAGQSAVDSKWYSSMGAEDQAWIVNRGLPDDPIEAAKAVVTSNRNVEKILGAEKAGRTVLLPEDGADDAEMLGFYEKLGRPVEASGYELKAEAFTEDAVKGMGEMFHAANLTKAQAQKLAGLMDEAKLNDDKIQTEEYEANREADDRELMTEWGQAYTKHLTEAKHAAAALRLDEPTIDKLEGALGYGPLMRLMHEIGAKIGEHGFVGDQQSNFGGPSYTPEQAQARLNELYKDSEFVARYMKGDSAAVREMQRLNRAVVGMA